MRKFTRIAVLAAAPAILIGAVATAAPAFAAANPGLSAMVAPAVPASASPAHGRAANVARYTVVRFGQCSAHGDFATCVASGNINHPSEIIAHVHANPNQQLSGAWSMVCGKGTGAGGTHGPITGTTPRVKPLRMPYAHPDSCSVAVDAQLSGSGSLNIYLTAHV
jgi:hypothetical protein